MKCFRRHPSFSICSKLNRQNCTVLKFFDCFISPVSNDFLFLFASHSSQKYTYLSLNCLVLSHFCHLSFGGFFFIGGDHFIEFNYIFCPKIKRCISLFSFLLSNACNVNDVIPKQEVHILFRNRQESLKK